MKINNSERLILENISKKYLQSIQRKPVDTITKIEFAIMAIEMYNRNCIWRFIEYLFVVFFSIKYLFTKKFDNLSIGRFQLKLSYILDYLNIKYSLSYRDITLTTTNVFPLLNVLLNRNVPEVLTRLITSDKYKISKSTDINSVEVRYFIEEYSCTLSTDTGFSYYFVFTKIVNQD